jgi:hypothetical protein
MNLTDKEIQRKLNQLTKLANELDAEAKRRWEKGGLFYADGDFNLLNNCEDMEYPSQDEIVEFRSKGLCRMDSGAW